MKRAGTLWKVSPVLKTVAVMLLAVTLATLGDLFMARAVKSVGEVDLTDLRAVWRVAPRVLSRPTVWWGLACMAGFFFLWISVLSWADLSLVLPMTALTYVFNALLAGPMLGERVSPRRWVGTLLIFVGVAVVAWSGGPGR